MPMLPDRRIVQVDIRVGCTQCGMCESTCPDVFTVAEGDCTITDQASTLFSTQRELIEEAAEGCPVEVISITYADGAPRPA
jgi:ferredoxin